MWILEVKRGTLPWTTRQTTSLLIFSGFTLPQSSLDSRQYEEEEEEEEKSGKNSKGEGNEYYVGDTDGSGPMNFIAGDFKRLLFD